jgi:hypothetical protein
MNTKRKVLATNEDWRAHKKARLEDQGYAPPRPAWVAQLDVACPLLTLAFAHQVLRDWEARGRPTDDLCGAAMNMLLDYHYHTPYVNVILYYTQYPGVTSPVLFITRRDVLLFAMKKRARITIPHDLEDTRSITLDPRSADDTCLDVLVYRAEDTNQTSLMNLFYLDEDPVRAWLEEHPDLKKEFKDFAKTPESKGPIMFDD